VGAEELATTQRTGRPSSRGAGDMEGQQQSSGRRARRRRGKGVLLTIEPSELVNKIPLGPNAGVLRVEMVFKPDAFLWRPTPEMIKMGDAVHGTIAWPLDKLKLPQPQSPAESNRKSNQVSL